MDERGMIWIGIDPGMSGGAAWIEQGPAPTNLLKVQAEKFSDKTPKDIFEIFRDKIMGERGLGQNFTAVIEQVHSMPKQGVSSSFKFGANYGLLQGFFTRWISSFCSSLRKNGKNVW